MTEVGIEGEIASTAAATGPPSTVAEPAGSRAAAEAELQRISRQGRATSLLREASLLPVLGLLIVVGAVISPVFLQASNFWGIGQEASALFVTTAGEALVLLIGSMDLSLGGTYGFAPMLAAWLVVPASAFGAGVGLNPALGVVVLLALGGVIGLVNGLLIVKARLNAFIVTLGMLILLAGCQDGVVKGQTISALPTAFTYVGGNFWGQVPVSLVVSMGVVAVIGVFLRYHRLGRAVYAVGGNAEAARAAGINVDRVKIGVFVAGGVLAALGGFMEMGHNAAITASQGYGESVIFTVFASAVIGGVSLAGGRGNMVGVATGVAVLAVVQNILDLKNVNVFWEEAVYGLVILVALVVARVIGGARSQA
jgi:simple sugar transport system permease protein